MCSYIRFALMSLVAACALVMGQNTPTFIGTWKLNLAESKPGSDIQTGTTKIEDAGIDTHTTIDESYRSGRKTHLQMTRTWDGKPHDVRAVGEGVHAEGATETCEIINSSTRKIVQGKNGRTISEVTAVLSDDGKKMTTTRKGGRDETLVYDKQ